MTTSKTEFAKTVKIYKSHKLANGFISVTFADVLSANCVSGQKTIKIEKIGGAVESLYNHYVLSK